MGECLRTSHQMLMKSTLTLLGPIIEDPMNFEQAWQSVLGQLQMEMPRASFDAWVRDTHAMSFEDGVLTVSVRNAYARDWLDSRLTSTVSRLLVGTLNANAAVQFVVADGEGTARSEQNLELQTKWEQLIQKLANEQQSYDEAIKRGNKIAYIHPQQMCRCSLA